MFRLTLYVLSVVTGLTGCLGCSSKSDTTEDLSSIERSLHDELWKDHGVLSDSDSPKDKIIFSTPKLQSVRDTIEWNHVVTLSQIADDCLLQLFAFYTTLERFPEHKYEIASRVILTTKRPGMALMADVYSTLESWSKDKAADSVLVTIENVTTNEENASLFVHGVSLEVLQHWFSSRSSKVPQPLQAAMLEELCDRMRKDTWSSGMSAMLEQYGEQNGMPLAVYLTFARADGKQFRQRLVRYLTQVDPTDPDLAAILTTHADLVQEELKMGHLPENVVRKIQSRVDKSQTGKGEDQKKG
jgi:hypothetical protein